MGLVSIALIGCQQQINESGLKHPETMGAKGCNKDLKMCPDGNGVGRNPLNNCEFHSCTLPAVKKGEPMMCTQDVKQCADGSFVGRDSKNNCAFKPCKNGNISNTH